jgi:superfamily II DNA or RNA helicase
MTFGDSVLNLPNDTRMLDVVRHGFEGATEVAVAVSFTRCSGLGLLIDPLRDIVERGGKVRILTSTYQYVTQPEALEILHRIPKLETRVQSGAAGFHSKFWWFGGAGAHECWAGSSNFTKGGLATNIEWNLRRTEPALMEGTKRQFESLWSRDDVFGLDERFIHEYKKSYEQNAVLPITGVADAPERMRPNPPQLEALAALAEVRRRGEQRAAVIAATGIGKTYLAAFDVERCGAKSVLYVSHRLEHLLQARRTFSAVLGTTRTLGVVGGQRDEQDADIVFATVASLGKRPELLNRDFDYLIIDELHHVEARSYEKLRPLRDRAFLLGMTATPERQDGHDVLEWCDWNVAYEVRLPAAIDHGWLLPFHYFGIADETVDFLKINWRQLNEVEDALSVDERAAHILHHALERGFDGTKRVTVAFCAGKKHARFMAEAFTRRGQTTAVAFGDQPVEEREEIYKRLANPHSSLQWLFVADVLNEGVDIPAINSVLFLRPTESATLFLQQLGRGLRLCPGTEVLTVLDFVGHHRSAWLTLNTLDAPEGGGRRTEVANGVVIKPPRACEVVLERRTRVILAKVQRFTTKKKECDDAYRRVRADLGRSLLPIDLWGRADVPAAQDFRQAYGTWVACQRANEDEPGWTNGLRDDHPVFGFLKTIEADWQAQRVAPYGLVWGLCADPGDPGRGYEAFFERWPQWAAERSPLEGSKTWQTVRSKLGRALVGDRLSPAIRDALGNSLLAEVEGRLMYTVNNDHQQRHGGVLRSPADLRLFARYDRPEIVRHFNKQYDPTIHNRGVLWFGDDAAITTKLDTSTAKAKHKYKNAFIDDRLFIWTSQNQMTPTNESGRKVIEHRARGLRLHLFVQRRSHESAYYLGIAEVVEHKGSGPMQVTLALPENLPGEVRKELLGG